jgi:hypothetical protein
MHHSHGGCPILAFFARACPELAEGVGGDAAGASLYMGYRATTFGRPILVAIALMRLAYHVCPDAKLTTTDPNNTEGKVPGVCENAKSTSTEMIRPFEMEGAFIKVTSFKPRL